jgi:hypothetical protein
MTKSHEECLASLAIKEMEIKIKLPLHLPPVRMTIIKNINSNKCWGGCGEKEPSYTFCGNVN